MVLLLIILVAIIFVVGVFQRRQSKHVLLEEAALNPKYREMIQESLLKEEVQDWDIIKKMI